MATQLKPVRRISNLLSNCDGRHHIAVCNFRKPPEKSSLTNGSSNSVYHVTTSYFEWLRAQ